jgi:hypothetical protein
MSDVFLPDRFRPLQTGRRSRRPLLLLVVVAALPFTALWWRVTAVEMSACQGLPRSVAASLDGVVGRFPLSVDPEWIRGQIEVWPVVESVDVRLELPGTLRINATAVQPAASVPMGEGWLAVAEDGRIAGSLDRPHEPLLVGFGFEAGELEQGLRVARRLEAASGARVEELRSITPVDFELRLRIGQNGRIVVVHVQHEATAAEHLWCERAAQGLDIPPWVDLRREDRLVIGGVV